MSAHERPGLASSADAHRKRLDRITDDLTAAGLPSEDKEVLRLVVDSQQRAEATELFEALESWRRDPTPRRLVRMSEMRSRPKPKWTIERMVPEWGVGQLVGPTASNKTFVAIDMSLCVANGVPTWAGDLTIQTPGDVVYVAMEGSFDLGDRSAAWLACHPGTTDDNVYVLDEGDLDLGSRSSVDRLQGDIADVTSDLRLLVIDTQSLAMSGRAEDSSTEMNVALANVKRLARELGCFVLLVHHTGWDVSRERGSSAQRQAVDLSLIVRNARVIEVQKIKAAGDPGPRVFEMVPSDRSLAVEWVTDIGRICALMSDESETDNVADFVRANPGASKSAVANGVGGNRDKRLRQIRDLLEDGVLVNGGSETRTALYLAAPP